MEQYRAPHLRSPHEPEPDRSYWLLIAGLGASISIGAAVYMLVSPLIEKVDFNLDPGAEPLVVAVVDETVEETPVPVIYPTATPAPTVSPVPDLSVTAPVIETESGDEYAEQVRQIADELQQSFERYLLFLSDARFLDPEWHDEMEAEHELWRELNQQVQDMEPSEPRGSYEALKLATDSFDQASDEFRRTYTGVDGSGIANGTQLLAEGIFYANQALIQLDREQS